MPMCFSSFLTPVLTQLFFQKPLTSFLTCFCRDEKPKYAGKKSCLNQGLNSQPPGHESDTLTTEPTGRRYTFQGISFFQISIFTTVGRKEGNEVPVELHFFFHREENMKKGENTGHSSSGCRTTGLCHGSVSVVCVSVCPSVYALTFISNIFSETT